MDAIFVYTSGKTEVKPVPEPLSPVFSIIHPRKNAEAEDLESLEKLLPVIHRFELSSSSPPTYTQVPIELHLHKYFRVLPEEEDN